MERLTILLGSGGTIHAGVPSTNAITEHLLEVSIPVGRASFFFFELLKQILVEKGKFGDVNFELMLHALEELIPLKAGDGILGRRDYFRPVLDAFIEIADHVNDLTQYGELEFWRETAIRNIFNFVSEAVARSEVKEANLSSFLTHLNDRFILKTFTLNYDDLIDRVELPWRDGFVENRPSSYFGFDPKQFLSASEDSEPLLVHLHGSIRYGYAQDGFIGIHKFKKTEVAKNYLSSNYGHRNIHGRMIVSGPIISGFSKVDQLFFRPAPYGYYLKSFIDNVVTNSRLLIIGYGGWDTHINDWILEFFNVHGPDARLVYATRGIRAENSSAGYNQALVKRILTDLAEYNKAVEQSPYYGKRVALEPAEFPFEDARTVKNIVQFLNS